MKPKSSLTKRVATVLLSILFVGCAGMQRSCASCGAEKFGADWIVVQMDNLGKPFRCWELHDVSIVNEEGSDGIYWKSDKTENLVHLSGFYNRIQVSNNNWEGALAEVGLTKKSCAAIHARSFDTEKWEYAGASASSAPR